MITKSKAKFARSIEHIEVELGAKHSLMQSLEGQNIPSAEERKKEQETKLGELKESQIEQAKKMQEEATKYSAGEQSSGSVESAEKQLQGQKTTADKTAEAQIKSAEAQIKSAEALTKTAEAQMQTAICSAEAQIESAKLQKQSEVDVAKVKADADVRIAKINSLTDDQKTLDANEIKALTIYTKMIMEDPRYALDPQKFIDDLNQARVEGQGATFLTTALGIDKSDAKELEKALKGDNKLLKADGKIDMETVIALDALIMENKEAIKEAAMPMLGRIFVKELIKAENLIPIPGMNSSPEFQEFPQKH